MSFFFTPVICHHRTLYPWPVIYYRPWSSTEKLELALSLTYQHTFELCFSLVKHAQHRSQRSHNADGTVHHYVRSRRPPQVRENPIFLHKSQFQHVRPQITTSYSRGGRDCHRESHWAKGVSPSSINLLSGIRIQLCVGGSTLGEYYTWAMIGLRLRSLRTRRSERRDIAPPLTLTIVIYISPFSRQRQPLVVQRQEYTRWATCEG